MLKGDNQSLERFKKLTVETVTLSAAGASLLHFVSESKIWHLKNKNKKNDLTEQKSTDCYSTVFVKSCSTCC